MCFVNLVCRHQFAHYNAVVKENAVNDAEIVAKM